MRHSNISIFIPHLGCPYNCIFCDQFKITGSDNAVTPLTVDTILKQASEDSKLHSESTQIAFFGGSFTAINKNLMIEYLTVANKYIENGCFDSIRISTRPDCINHEVLEILKKFNVKTIELGIQSFDDEVLKNSKRGHTSETAFKSCKLITDYGFELGLQMMCGLPSDNEQKDLYTANKIIETGCKQVRIYPVVVIEGTELAKMYKNGEYTPLNTEEAVSICAKLYTLFTKNNVTILKMGLHSESNNIAGPFHPAFGELVRSKAFYDSLIEQLDKNCEYEIAVKPNFYSIAVGNKKKNVKQLINSGYKVTFSTDNHIDDTYRIIKTSE